jgi:hypothetical protein
MPKQGKELNSMIKPMATGCKDRVEKESHLPLHFAYASQIWGQSKNTVALVMQVK